MKMKTLGSLRSLLASLAAILLCALPLTAQVSGKAERMAQGFGNVSVSVGTSPTEVGRVTVKTKSAGFCAVNASYKADLEHDELLVVTLADAPAEYGPWNQGHKNTLGSTESISGFITQTFDVPAATAKKFYLNAYANNFAAPRSIPVELTRIWVVCGIGNSQG